MAIRTYRLKILMQKFFQYKKIARIIIFPAEYFPIHTH